MMPEETPPPRPSRRPNELVRAVERGLGRFLLDVEIDPHDRRRLAIDLIEALASAGIILVTRHHRPPAATDAPSDNSDTSKGKTE